jgi:SAM-dependent methyltransferase
MKTFDRQSSATKRAPKFAQAATLPNKPAAPAAIAAVASNHEIPTRFLIVDEEGYFVVDGLRVADVNLGHDWMSRIRMDDRGRAILINEPDSRVIVEAFDQPLVALDAEVTIKTDGTPELKARFPYGFQAHLRFDSLRVDEWDRFYARTEDGVPVVLSRSAQSRFFQMATEYDDDSISFGEHTFETRPLFDEFEDATDAQWWDERYETGDTRWDGAGAHPLLDSLIPPLKITRCRVLVLGCGAGHDAAWWERQGHIVTGVDFSQEAIDRARAQYGERDSLKWVQADAFKLPKDWSSRFDIIFENTMFCAIPPARREELVRTWWRLLTPRGRVIGLALVMDKLSGPPYGSSEWEIRKRLLTAPQHGASSSRRARFLPLLWNREKKSSERRLGHELFFVVERADSLTE